MVRNNRRHSSSNKRNRSPCSAAGAALGESLPSTPQVGPMRGRDAGDVAGGDDHLNALSSDGALDHEASAPRSSEEADSRHTPPHVSHASSQTVKPAPAAITPASQVTINVGGRLFSCFAATLCKEPSVLSRDVNSGFRRCLRDEEGHPFYDRDPDTFALVMLYLRGYPLMLGAEETRQLAQDAVYFDIKGLREVTGVDPSQINWRFQRGPGVAPDGKTFHGSEVVSLIGSGPLLPGETSVVFFRVEKRSQMAVGLVPPDIPLNEHFSKHRNVICYDSAGEVTCSVVTNPHLATLPDAVARLIPRLLMHDLTKILGVGAEAASGMFAAYGIEVGSRGRRKAAGRGTDASPGGAQDEAPSPSLLAVGSSTAPSPDEEDDAVFGGGTSLPFNTTGAPSLTIEAIAPLQSPFLCGEADADTSIELLADTAALPTQTNAGDAPVMSPYVMPQQQLLQPRGSVSLQPSQLPPMPSPLFSGAGVAVTAPSAGPSPVLLPLDTPHLPPTRPDGGPAGRSIALSASALQQQRHPAADPKHGDPFELLPHLVSTVTASTAVAPRTKDGDELCVVAHLSEDSSCAIVRFYRQQQILHVVVAFGELAPIEKSFFGNKNTDTVAGSDSDDDDIARALPHQHRTHKAPAGLNDDSVAAAGGKVSKKARRRGKKEAAQCVLSSPADDTIAAMYFPHYRPRMPLPPLQLALFARSATTVFTSDTRTVKKDIPARNNSNPLLSASAQSIPIRQQRPPIVMYPATYRVQPFALAQGNETQFQSYLQMCPETVTALAAAAAQPGPVTNMGSAANLLAMRDALLSSITSTFRAAVAACPAIESCGVFEYFWAVPRFFDVLTLDDADVARMAAGGPPPLPPSASAPPLLFPISNNFLSLVASAVRSTVAADTTISGMMRRQHGEAIATLEHLETRRRNALALATGDESMSEVSELVQLLLTDPSAVWERLVSSQQQPATAGRTLLFRSAREMLNNEPNA